MKTIIDFLQNGSDNIDFLDVLLENEKLSKNFKEITKIISISKSSKENIFSPKKFPAVEKGQIWQCKQNYYDFFGNEIVGDFPYLVLIVTNPDKIEDEYFVRVQPISPFTEFKANDEILINDKRVTGFEFIVETWNEQPILTNILDEYVDTLWSEPKVIPKLEYSLTREQKIFRKEEIRNSAYLRQSVASLIQYKEQQEKHAVIMNINNAVIYPEIEEKESDYFPFVNEPSQGYLQAAKNKIRKKRQVYVFENSDLGLEVKIKIIKDIDGFMIKIIKPNDFEITDAQGKILKQTENNLFDKLPDGLYILRVNGIDDSIRLKLR